ncbi:MAG: tRNA (adenosine(37)-N6)-dimethylallyltransferase MiaA [Thermodesulfobacteriota bacterium]|nr:tRNA (adenosine(37)-N6)-dimethylallyltransferase MiaA [Thermodesulfobacteriota bacterium]
MMENGRPKVVVIAGPTASGKTSLGVELAQALRGEIINADSMQVYRRMDLGTAKPTPEKQKGIPHHLLDIVDPDEEFNAAIYRSMALPLVENINMREKTCLVVGGTGLYIKILLGGLLECSSTDKGLRESLRQESEFYGPASLHKRLRLLDPESAEKIHPNDGQRITRALEIVHLTNERPSDLIREHRFGNRPLSALKLCLKVDKEKLYYHINERSVAMVEAGLPEETESLLKNGYSEALKPMKAIGYRHMVRYLKGDWSLAEAIHNLQRDTRRYAKRQLTWFKADPEITWVIPEDLDLVLQKIRAFLHKTP